MSKARCLPAILAALLAAAFTCAASSVEDPREGAAPAAARPFLVGCPDNLGGGPWEDEGGRHQGHWFFTPRKLKGRTLNITYSRLHDGNGTRCDPVVGPFVASKWAGLGRGMITLAPRGSAGDMHTINLTALKPGVEYYIVDTFQDAWQRYRAYRSITLE